MRLLLFAFASLLCLEAVAQPEPPTDLDLPRRPFHPFDLPEGYKPGYSVRTLGEALNYIEAVKARDEFRVTGRTLAVAVIDTGINKDHDDFTGRPDKIVGGRNVYDPARSTDVTDEYGHGSHVAGIIAASGLHQGVAYDASIVPIKVTNSSSAPSSRIYQALQYVLEVREQFRISVVNISFAKQSYTSDVFASEILRDAIQSLRQERVAVVISAGNCYRSVPGMAYPAILREAVSVGAVYDDALGINIPYECGQACERGMPVRANTTGPGRFTPFTQRLPEQVYAGLGTDIFAPGANIASTGILGTQSVSESGTSMAAPMVAGVILLLQQFWLDRTGDLPDVDFIEKWLREGASELYDGDDEDDTVCNSEQTYHVLNAYRSLQAAEADLPPPPPQVEGTTPHSHPEPLDDTGTDDPSADELPSPAAG